MPEPIWTFFKTSELDADQVRVMKTGIVTNGGRDHYAIKCGKQLTDHECKGAIVKYTFLKLINDPRTSLTEKLVMQMQLRVARN